MPPYRQPGAQIGLQRTPAVHLNYLPGDVRGQIRTQETHQRGNVFHVAEAPQRNTRFDEIDHFGGYYAKHVRADVARRNRVEPDTMRCDLCELGHRLDARRLARNDRGW